jgi:Protein of unknown function (DUF2281).
MNLAETIYQKSLDLPEDKAIEVIDFIDSLKTVPDPASLSKKLRLKTNPMPYNQTGKI